MSFYHEQSACKQCVWTPEGLPRLCSDCEKLAQTYEHKIAEAAIKRLPPEE